MIINSISGGKTSAYIAKHYKADLDMFALVCVEDAKCKHPDKKIIQMTNDKLSHYGNRFGEFIGTAESYIILNTIFSLEQHIGREITFVRGVSFDKLIEQKKSIPNLKQRWCTTEMKIKPIFEYCFLNFDLPIINRIGYRYDEKERANNINNDFQYTISCNNFKQKRQNHKIFKDWRVCEFPLIEDKISHYHIQKYWNENKQVTFAKDSNCQMCFWKDAMQLRKNFVDMPAQMEWAINQ